jgi:hypothetical protein
MAVELPSLPAVHQPSIGPSSSLATAHVVDPAFEERWAAWSARGRREDMSVRRRMRVIALIAVVLGLVMLGIVLAGGSL